MNLRIRSSAAFIVGLLQFGAALAAADVPAAAAGAAPASQTQSLVLAGGCFWGVQAVFQHVKGVIQATSGYAGGNAATANYEAVSSGTSGHAESVRVVFDPSIVSLNQLLQVFFSVAHDPTELNRQGPDSGTQYRSAIFYSTEEQRLAAQAFIAQLQASKTYAAPIVTKVDALRGFYSAEAYHQNYFKNHPNDRYIFINDRPKVENLKARFPQLYVDG